MQQELERGAGRNSVGDAAHPIATGLANGPRALRAAALIRVVFALAATGLACWATMARAQTGAVAADAATPGAVQPAAGRHLRSDEPRAEESDPYRRALLSLEAGRVDEAIVGLEAVVARDPGDLGAWLDLAIANCRAGHGKRAEQLFSFLESSAKVPYGIADVIAYHRGIGCRAAAQPSSGRSAFVAIGAGRHSNVNLGPLAAEIRLPELGLLLPLAESARPRDAALNAGEAGVRLQLSDPGLTVGAYAQHRAYRGAGEFDQTVALLSIDYARSLSPGRSDGLGASLGWIGIGGHSQAAAGALHAQTTMVLTDRLGLSAGASVSRLAYAIEGAFDSTQAELRARLIFGAGAGAALTAEVAAISDDADDARAGGDRRGTAVRLSASWKPAARHTIEVAYRHQRLRDERAYNPVFFGDARRTPRLQNLQASWTTRLTPALSLRLEVQAHRSRDRIDLFNYDSSAGALWLEWRTAR